MCVQQAVSDAYASATGARASGQAAVMQSELEPCNPARTRSDPTGWVEFRIVGFGSGRIKILYCRIGSS